MIAVDANRLGVVGVAGPAEKEGILPLAEDEELPELFAEALGPQAGRGDQE